MRKINQQRLEELTEWARNKPEDAALRIIELENLLGGDGAEPLPVTPNQPWTPPKEPAEASPALPDWSGGITYPRCVICKNVHPPSMQCPTYWMENGVYSAVETQ